MIPGLGFFRGGSFWKFMRGSFMFYEAEVNNTGSKQRTSILSVG